MTKTGQQIEDDVYNLLIDSPLSSMISGAVYKFGLRPMNSLAEDAVVQFVTGLDGATQEGSLVVNIYVPDVEVFDDGVYRRDIARCTQIEIESSTWVESLPVGEYIFSTAATTQTFQEESIKQHFISIRLKYKRSLN